MKSIKVYAADEIIEDIKKTAKLFNMSASRYMIHLHAMKQEKKYPGRPRGSKVSLEVVKDSSPGKIKSEGYLSMTGFGGSYSKAQQTGKKSGAK